MPDQVPGCTVSVEPTVAWPETEGGAVLEGAVPEGCVTTVLCAESAKAEPAELEALSRTRTVEPTSPATTA